MKGLSGYHMKEAYLEDLICQIVLEREFSLSHLEQLTWSLSKRLTCECHYPDKILAAAKSCVNQMSDRFMQLKPRDLAFTIEAVSHLPDVSDHLYTKFEKAALLRMQEFLPHYMIKIMVSLNRAQQGSGELFS